MRRETNSWRWPAFAFTYLLTLAYGASFFTYRLVGAFTA
jgi:ferrous iron transport protein B